MQRLFVFMSGWLILVPVLGLSSACSKKVDEWAMKEPVVTGAGLHPISLRAAVSRVLPADAKIEFNLSDYQTLSITSKCSLDDRIFTEKYQLQYQPMVAIKSIWPHALWLNNRAEDMLRASCDFTFYALSSTGSSQDFDLREIKLSSFLGSSSVLSAQTLASRPMFGAYLDEASEYRLICGSHVAKLRTSASPTALVEALKSQLHLYGLQRCHFVSGLSVEESTLSDFVVSPEGLTQFPQVPVKVETLGQPTTDFFKPDELLISFAATNQGESDTFLRLPSGVQAAHAYVHLDGTSRVPRAIQINIETAGADVVSNDGRLATFKLAPGITLRIDLRTNHDTSQDLFSLIAPGGGYGQRSITSLEYGLDEPFTVRESSDIQSGDQIEILTLPGGAANGQLPFEFRISPRKPF